jgi:hypothetical protein
VADEGEDLALAGGVLGGNCAWVSYKGSSRLAAISDEARQVRLRQIMIRRAELAAVTPGRRWRCPCRIYPTIIDYAVDRTIIHLPYNRGRGGRSSCPSDDIKPTI